jgi:hypothetical protein
MDWDTSTSVGREQHLGGPPRSLVLARGHGASLGIPTSNVVR